MLTRTIIRAARPAIMRQQRRKYASDPNKATSRPQGTHGGAMPSRGEPEGKTKYYYGGYAAAAVGIGGAGYYFLSGKSDA